MDDLDIIGSCIYRDRTVTTYKYSLFLSLVDICKNYPYLPKKIYLDNEERIEIPMGIMVLKWIEYYYPYYYPYKFIFIGKNNRNDEYDRNGVTQSSETSHLFQNLESEYGYSDNGLNRLSHEIIHTEIPKERQKSFISLANHLQTIILHEVMKKFGKSFFKDEYSIFKIESDKSLKYNGTRKLNINTLIKNMGMFSIPISLYEEICVNNVEKIYDRTRVIENWIKCLLKANDSLDEDPEYILSLIPSIPGDAKFHSSVNFKNVVYHLRDGWNICVPPIEGYI